MSEGLITRLGKWLDEKWESKATHSELVAVSLDAHKALKDSEHRLNEAIAGAITAMAGNDALINKDLAPAIKGLATLRDLFGKLETKVLAMKPLDGDLLNKELSDLKTRIEKLELYTGMGRKIDPTKQPVAKTAFQM